MTLIIGISAFYHDSAAVALVDGEIAAAAQEERFSRVKGDARFPKAAFEYCLRKTACGVSDIDYLVFYDKPIRKFDRLLETYLSIAPSGYRSLVKGIPVWTKEKLWLEKLIERESSYDKHVFFGDHHESHAASAFYPSPFVSAAILTVDGVGEWSTACIGKGAGNEISLTHEIPFPHSLGLLYSAFTYYLGFKVNSGEYKVMGLAPYGEPEYRDLIWDNLLDVKEDGSFRLNMRYFNYLGGLTMTNDRFHKLFGGAPRAPESELTERHMNIASSIQAVVEEILLRLARTARKLTGEKRLCLAGGVALNCVANGKILKAGIFADIWIQPASGDAGGALGAALSLWHRYLGKPRTPRTPDSMHGALLGPEHDDGEIKAALESEGVAYEELRAEDIPARTAKLLADGAVVGWFQGRLEFGPRALGSRSILGDPRDPEMQKRMNVKIKFRESFRPFAPVVKEDKRREWFDLPCSSPYMLLVADVAHNKRVESSPVGGGDILKRLSGPRSEIQAVTHVDYSARVQTVRRETNPLYYDVIDEFEKLTGCPVLVNTSFNVRGEPIVCSPKDAIRCLMRTEMDYLVIGKFLISSSARKGREPEEVWRKEYPLD